MMLPSAASIAVADTFTYELNGSYAESNGGPSLVPYGGTLGSMGYTFGVQQGLSLSGTGIYDAYSIAIRFYFDDFRLRPFLAPSLARACRASSSRAVVFSPGGDGVRKSPEPPAQSAVVSG
jgi:hypothetical protein